jgi:hypothetical protein
LSRETRKDMRRARLDRRKTTPILGLPGSIIC